MTVDGVDVRELTFGDLRGAIGLVSQDVFLFDGTVRENIAYGDPDAPDEAVEEAARLAEAHDFIAALADGYDTLVGERGQKLSGGAAPAAVHRPGDRAGPGDPGAGRGDVRRGQRDRGGDPAVLEMVSKDRTTLVIAHRLSTVRHADRIHVLENGMVREAGTHDELVATGGLYAALWRVQTGEETLV